MEQHYLRCRRHRAFEKFLCAAKLIKSRARTAFIVVGFEQARQAPALALLHSSQSCGLLCRCCGISKPCLRHTVSKFVSQSLHLKDSDAAVQLLCWFLDPTSRHLQDLIIANLVTKGSSLFRILLRRVYLFRV